MPYKDKVTELASKRRIYKRNKEYIHKLKSVPCADCGNTYPPVCMDFDHVKGKKHRPLSRMVHYSIERIDEEIAKCEVVCANCHRIRSHENGVYNKPMAGHA